MSHEELAERIEKLEATADSQQARLESLARRMEQVFNWLNGLSVDGGQRRGTPPPPQETAEQDFASALPCDTE